MSKERGRPARLEVGMEVVRIPQSLYEADRKGKGERRPMRGRVVYIPRGACSIQWNFRHAAER